MAFVLKSLSLSFLLICFLLLLQHSDGINGAEETLNDGSSIKEISNRKLLVVNGLEAKEAVVFSIAGKSSKVEEEGWELRAAPLGPDPLHHHGADPRKPRTP